jgi:hypothetical protein
MNNNLLYDISHESFNIISISSQTTVTESNLFSLSFIRHHVKSCSPTKLNEKDLMMKMKVDSMTEWFYLTLSQTSLSENGEFLLKKLSKTFELLVLKHQDDKSEILKQSLQMIDFLFSL